ncbi:membrane protein insertion efficiency factor YidD [Massilia oculi]|uniref:Putative membrane protein insertion efficiency factor n=1 Tax=Massilia hydrophila TaxID=3044279 RepID=A0ABS7YBW9_9BURK|nr:MULTISPECIES: membrane protein insertion efficiency factor YidD [Massilia]MCA1248701.1 membrane protein insertion efficiency factor YidD [Massilia sp. MS-15]MCA1857201.1 membrane protein insertion efficiency factor YidD [Massilia oculi]
MKTLLVWFLRGYQLLLSPLLGQKCRFYPTCSNYAIEALRVHGAARGSLLAARRVCRCHPWNPGGVDFVPAPKDKDQPSPPAARGCNHS